MAAVWTMWKWNDWNEKKWEAGIWFSNRLQKSSFDSDAFDLTFSSMS
jgi:hypothetical protein